MTDEIENGNDGNVLVPSSIVLRPVDVLGLNRAFDKTTCFLCGTDGCSNRPANRKGNATVLQMDFGTKQGNKPHEYPTKRNILGGRFQEAERELWTNPMRGSQMLTLLSW
jgi:hypothetical protein